ncbi:protein NRT1/ PTR FAMILY 3.1 isoform X1 [Lactuca sativa]|uniref:protein NRT1/ PTR FAMILY 3.1 isoform X1 n=1 Tax=Lactuca sativa TaxID=4236 RepID=UPI000CD961C4|nr:protein NRT1/ PTR FAMILY 3.1 isoform X1 [Lactuca sativa]
MEPENEHMKDEESMDVAKRKKLGGIKTLPFILANEICDRFAATGFHANLITYLTQQLNMPLVKASNTLTNFNGVASFMPIIGALVADSFAGRYFTIIIALLIYELGMIIITISSILPQFRPPQCPTQVNCKEASSSQLSVLYISLLLTSVGLGGTRPCVVAFAADQLDISKLKTQAKTTSWNFFNWYYFFLSLASLSALTVVVYIQDRVSWGWGLGIPTIAMGIAFVAFLVGSPLYQNIKPQGSPFVRLAQVIVAATKKWKSVVPLDDNLLYQNKELDASISKDGRLVHTNQLKWFDKAAIVTDEDTDLISNSPKLWRIATVHRVEELKSMIRLLPIISTGIIYVMAYSHQASFTLTQARTMDRHLSPSFEIPPASMAVFGVIGTLVTLALYDRVFVPFAYRFTKNPSGITCLQRIGVGFVVNILATFVGSFVEIKRKQVARNHNLLDKPTVMIPISVFWLVPQYSLHGVAEAMFHVGKLEFLYDQSPESMKSTALALYWSAIAVGQYAGTLMVTMVHKYTNKNGRNWLPDRNLNRGRLEYYYMLVSGIQVLNLFYYFACAWFYTYKPLEEHAKSKEDGDLELVVDNTTI